ncbi:N-acyl amino acid synthase FeeM domain-containing protein [Legionella rowbothamii]|uniref:N-acyl amino acid synthase FeeM domain-containing protein n=1 Tax=Legionella rowbothamii TaxID=96229 RepID=UPI001056230A|nr:GNAT family N-acyltransferase [Legionella rowbothamii]
MDNRYLGKELSVDSREYLDVCRLRYQTFTIYLNEHSELVEYIDGIPSLKPCKYDKHSVIFAVYNEKECIGTIRLIIRNSKKNHFLEIEESSICKLKPFVHDDYKVAEVGRLVVDKKYRTQANVVFMLFNYVTQYSIKNHLDYLVCEAPVHLSKHYSRLGWEVVEENKPWSVNEQILLKHLLFDIRGHRMRAKCYGYMMGMLVKNPHFYKVFFH